jgi:hypothetical protein
MQLGNKYVPETRLVPTAINDIKKIYEEISKSKEDKFKAEKMAHILGYEDTSSGAYHRKVLSLVLHGLIAGKGVFTITTLGKEIPYASDNAQRSRLYKEAILRIPLWKELYKSYKKSPPEDIRPDLKQLTGAEGPQIENYYKKVRRWYIADIKSLPDEASEEPVVEVAKSYILPGSTEKLQPMDLESDNQPPIHNEIERIPFGRNIIISLPKKDIRKWWEKAQKHMELFLEDYEERSSPDS